MLLLLDKQYVLYRERERKTLLHVKIPTVWLCKQKSLIAHTRTARYPHGDTILMTVRDSMGCWKSESPKKLQQFVEQNPPHEPRLVDHVRPGGAGSPP